VLTLESVEARKVASGCVRLGGRQQSSLRLLGGEERSPHGGRAGIAPKAAQALDLAGGSGSDLVVRPAEALGVVDGAPAGDRARDRDACDDDGRKTENDPGDPGLPSRDRASKGCRSASTHQLCVGGATTAGNPLNG
jgi:hypothetical protein